MVRSNVVRIECKNYFWSFEEGQEDKDVMNGNGVFKVKPNTKQDMLLKAVLKLKELVSMKLLLQNVDLKH